MMTLDEIRKLENDLADAIYKLELAMEGGLIANPIHFIFAPFLWAIACGCQKMLLWLIETEENK